MSLRASLNRGSPRTAVVIFLGLGVLAVAGCERPDQNSSPPSTAEPSAGVPSAAEKQLAERWPAFYSAVQGEMGKCDAAYAALIALPVQQTPEFASAGDQVQTACGPVQDRLTAIAQPTNQAPAAADALNMWLVALAMSAERRAGLGTVAARWVRSPLQDDEATLRKIIAEEAGYDTAREGLAAKAGSAPEGGASSTKEDRAQRARYSRKAASVLRGLEGAWTTCSRATEAAESGAMSSDNAQARCQRTANAIGDLREPDDASDADRTYIGGALDVCERAAMFAGTPPSMRDTTDTDEPTVADCDARISGLRSRLNLLREVN